jgi:hypothetical protein
MKSKEGTASKNLTPSKRKHQNSDKSVQLDKDDPLRKVHSQCCRHLRSFSQVHDDKMQSIDINVYNPRLASPARMHVYKAIYRE